MNTPKTAASTRKRPGKQLVLLILAVLVLTAAFFVIKGLGSNEAAQTAYQKVVRQDFLVTIVEGGTLEAVREVVVRNEVDGEARVIFLIPEGTFVKKGDLVVELETSEAEDKVNQQQLAYEKARSVFVQAENDLEIQRSVIQSQVDAAELKLEFARSDLNKYLKGERVSLLRDAEIKITTARSDLLLAKETLDWSIRLEAKGFETKDAVTKGSNSVLGLTLQLEQAETNKWMLETFDQPKQMRTYESAVEETQKELDRVIAQGNGKIAQLVADLITQSNSLQLTSTKLEDDRDRLTKSKIYAPQDGLVVYAMNRSRYSSQSMIEEGAEVRERQELIKLPDTSEMKVGIKIHESHVSKVRAGQSAFVVLDPLPDRRFTAQVTKVGVLPDTQSSFGNPNLKVYKTEVLILEKLPEDVKPGVSARAEIVITNILKALTVPVQAVTSYKGQSVVFVRDGDGNTPVPVEVGLFNTKFIEIISGLTEGQEVLLAPPFDLQEKDLGGAIIGKEDEIPQPVELPPTVIAPTPDSPSEGSEPRPQGGSGEGRNRGGDGSPREGRGSGGNREEMLKRFDKNGDGQIDDNERAEMRRQLGGGGRTGGGRTGGGGAGDGGRGEGRPPESQ